MSQNKPSRLKPPTDLGLIGQLVLQIKLILRLMGDSRVNPFLKVLPVISVLYWLIPDLIPGPIDDAGLMFLGGYLFIELCPRAVVNEHLRELTGESSDPDVPTQADPTKEREDVVDGEFRDI